MEFEQALAKLTASTLFKEWHSQHNAYFLAHAFKMIGDEDWQIGWCHDNKIVTFVVSDMITKTDEQEALTEEKIEKLELQNLKIDEKEALAVADAKFAKQEPVLKQFYIIQTAKGKTIYNVTYFTQSYNTYNIHIDAETGDVLRENKQRLLDFR